jgi:hypothetical protein
MGATLDIFAVLARIVIVLVLVALPMLAASTSSESHRPSGEDSGRSKRRRPML